MDRKLLVICYIILFTSCKMLPSSDKQYETAASNKVYHLQLNPKPESKYQYDFNQSINILSKVGDNEIDNTNSLNIGIIYSVGRDSVGNVILGMQYTDINIHSKNGESENVVDATTAGLTGNPVEKMLSILKSAELVATVGNSGEIISVKGYQEVNEKMIQNLGTLNSEERNAAKAQLNQLIEKGVIKSSLEQLFKIFPDSSIRIGDKWKMETSQHNQLELKAKSSYLLKDVQDSVAIITSKGEIVSDSSTVNFMGQMVTPHINGEQEGTYKINNHTGMLIESEIKGRVEGTIDVLGNQVPVKIKTVIKVVGKEIN